jgi:putative hydrolase of the HAD superfamily
LRRGGSSGRTASENGRSRRVWLFDLDDTLHDAHRSAMPELSRAMGAYIERELGLTTAQSDALRRQYFLRYGATLLGLIRHHGVKAAHFLHQTHLLPGLEQRVRRHPHDVAALAALPGARYILTNAPRAYAERVLRALGLLPLFDAVFTIEDMAMFGQLRPKPDARMLRRLVARLRLTPSRCVLVEDTLAHQKAARRIGMRTVWLQRWIRHQPARAAGRARKPAYVDLKARSLRDLRRLK